MIQHFWAPTVLLGSKWSHDVLMSVDTNGNFAKIEEKISKSNLPEKCEILGGTVIPGIPNCHSHAHQRAMAGLGEKNINSNFGSGGFWAWRQAMYQYLGNLTPDLLCVVAKMIYLEMLKGGYTAVAEFQYVHNDLDGGNYDDSAEMTKQCLFAAQEVGIGITALPVLYQYGGFNDAAPSGAQNRFVNTCDSFNLIMEEVLTHTKQDENLACGFAAHSLRSTTVENIKNVEEIWREKGVKAFHIHIAEQVKEVQDCCQQFNASPINWLYDNVYIDDKWTLIHATHATPSELRRIAKSKAVVGLCPSTEGNLGDGVFDLSNFISYGGSIALGSDSQVCVNPAEEMRWLEYEQRLRSYQRNVMANSSFPNVGMAILNKVLSGGAQSCARNIGAIRLDYRADMLVLDETHSRAVGRSEDSLVDSWVFAGDQSMINDVFVGGKQVIKNRHHAKEYIIKKQFLYAVRQLAQGI